MALGIRLSKMQGRAVGPDDIAPILEKAAIRYVLIGGHASNAYSGRPRATVDVDLIPDDCPGAIHALSSAFPHLEMTKSFEANRFSDSSLEVIDLIRHTSSRLWPALLKNSVRLTVENIELHVPTVEGVLAAKFMAMRTPGRQIPDKMQDAADFIRVVEANPQIDLKTLADLGELVYPGGGRHLLKFISDARAGKKLDV
jgi:hypothetical protein